MSKDDVHGYLDLDKYTDSYIEQSFPQEFARAAPESQPVDQQGLPQQQPQHHGQVKTASSITSSIAGDSIRLDVPGVPALPLGADPRKMCPFCKRTFTYPGSLGRHLDLKKGTDDHPADVILLMRAEVKRRGDKRAVQERRRQRSRAYNAREDVRQRNKEQRRVRDRVLRAKKSAMTKFTNRLGRPVLQPHPSFARLVLYFLPPDKWPHDPPTLETRTQLCSHIADMYFSQDQGQDEFESVMVKVSAASENWQTLEDSVKQDIWIRELRRAAEDALTNTSLFELKNRDTWISKEAEMAVANNEDSDGEGTNGDTQAQIEQIQQQTILSADQQLNDDGQTQLSRAPRNIRMKPIAIPPPAPPPTSMPLETAIPVHTTHQTPIFMGQLAAAAVASNVEGTKPDDHDHLDPQLMTR
ncbi:CYFA0S44e00144g1_1 [Cyberlindnera fabianii]|uniref:CYFA0S44e00144g1_1 n=1 Tax=Cyberlindnera fabianii TaxID=36022 RepID=A0A061BDL1_CYBFA|nr:hypothetical protein BON22_5049 [Cyberlindnera fabianii]CDR48041.1 CYFA0S44e00144g1_1 [Cyberlindnera fabianii]